MDLYPRVTVQLEMAPCQVFLPVKRASNCADLGFLQRGGRGYGKGLAR